MKKTGLFLCMLIFISGIQLHGQDSDRTLMEISGDKIKVSDFENIYRKNNSHDAIDKKSIDEYVELFINFKLKVKEAEDLGLDTSKAFLNELANYRNQLTQPYLRDREVSENLVKEAYDRLKEEVRASHILVKLPPDASPKDTLAAYNKIMKIRKDITKGNSFGDMAGRASDDPSAKSNKGDLGWFTAFYMVYPFETAAYQTPVGEISMPVRTRFGYHLIKVEDKRPARGEIRTAHIMIASSDKSSAENKEAAKNKIEEIYEKLLAGENFAKLAQMHSDDKGSARKGGELPWFPTPTLRMVESFEETAFALGEDGAFSKPVQTPYGWHIIKRLERRGVPSFNEMKAELKTKTEKDSRGNQSRASLIRKLKKEYQLQPQVKNRAEFYKIVNDEYFTGKWKADKAAGLNKPVLVIIDEKYQKKELEFNQEDFASFIEKNQQKHPKSDIKTLVNTLYDEFTDEALLNYEKSNLEYKYPEFRMLMQEYRDGILLFDLMEKKIWSKAITDSAGLADFYAKNKTNYMWGKRIDAALYTAADESVAKKARKLAKKQDKKGYTNADILKMINEDSQLNLKIEAGKFTKGDNEIIDSITWQTGLTDNIVRKEGNIIFVKINKVMEPQPKSLEEARGIVTADFQTFLEEQWLEELRSKYEVKVNREVLTTIK